MGASYPTKIALAFRSGNRCAYPKCGAELVLEAKEGSDKLVAEAAHIAGEKPDSARYDASMADEQRNALENLIFMCPTHHTLIDKAADDWPTESLLELKSEHERRVSEAISAGFSEVAFGELANAVSWVSNQDAAPKISDFSLLPPQEKIDKNQLSIRSKNIIIAGLVSQQVVSEFVSAETRLDADFPEKLKAGFLIEYYRLIKEGQKGDALFELMCSFAQQGMSSQAERSAGLAVLVYLFELCEVFEK
ncbi:HNH endonuclease [Hyphobacterium sp. SN044]|uniref:HNH endonuclease signature motif containing protein n=1 Tax=Hyphobacterium sp. SN044 TaxID=2912575 RepID=UPI001F17AEA0|nr:HNH endonuclease signature motif containing protein [Hyphobacterium sp. SN044]MCF8880369.1 HNH endonuclease [Hyphobacterium sp. SN044]